MKSILKSAFSRQHLTCAVAALALVGSQSTAQTQITSVEFDSATQQVTLHWLDAGGTYSIQASDDLAWDSMDVDVIELSEGDQTPMGDELRFVFTDANATGSSRFWRVVAEENARDTALAKIAAYAEDSSNPAPTLQDYMDAGVIGVRGTTLLNRVNAAVAVVMNRELADETAEIQALAAPPIAITKISNYALQSSGPVPTVQDYADAGVTGVTTATLAAVNSVVEALTARVEADTVAEIQALATPAIALAKIAAYAEDDTLNPAPTVQDYADAGVTGVTTGNLADVNTAVAAVTGEQADETAEVQALVAQAIALTKIAAYARSSLSPVPTLQDYTDAGVTGVTAANLEGVNVAIVAVEEMDADTTAEIQALVDTHLAAITRIADYADDSSNPAPTREDYANASVTGVGVAILADINAIIAARNRGQADTRAEIQALVDLHTTALARIAAYAHTISNPTPTLQDYTNARVTGVTSASLSRVNLAVARVIGVEADTRAEIQVLATRGIALFRIANYALSNSNPAPRLQDYADAGVTGGSAVKLSHWNRAVDALAASSNADTTAEVQAVVDAAVIDLSGNTGFQGLLIRPVKVKIDDNNNTRTFYYWDRSGNGNADGDLVNHNVLDNLFNNNSDTRNTESMREATVSVNGESLTLRLPTYNGPDKRLASNNTFSGTSVDSPTENQTHYKGLLAIWDAHNGSGTGKNLNGVPTGWFSGQYWSATPTTVLGINTLGEHAALNFTTGRVIRAIDSSNNFAAALEVID